MFRLLWSELAQSCVDISLNGPRLETIKSGHQTFVILSETSSDPGLWLVNCHYPGLSLAGGDETWHFPSRGPQRLRTRNFNNQREIRQRGSSSLAQIPSPPVHFIRIFWDNLWIFSCNKQPRQWLINSFKTWNLERGREWENRWNDSLIATDLGELWWVI